MKLKGSDEVFDQLINKVKLDHKQWISPIVQYSILIFDSYI